MASLEMLTTPPIKLVAGPVAEPMLMVLLVRGNHKSRGTSTAWLSLLRVMAP